MAKFIIDEQFTDILQVSIEQFANKYAQICTTLIDTPRYWEDWTTSDPFRDIVDTGALRDSIAIDQINDYCHTISWITAYVEFVYFGHMTRKGNWIPPRKWAELVIQENDLLYIYAAILINLFNKAYK
jgi:hypothetical protein